MESGNDGYASRQTVMEYLGIEDTDAELALIKAEGAGSIGQMIEKANALATLVGAKFPVSVAVKMLGFPEEFHAEIIAEVKKQQDQEQQNKLAEIKAKGASTAWKRVPSRSLTSTKGDESSSRRPAPAAKR